MFIGHQKQWKFLKNSLKQDKVSHAYLFYGQQQLGKRTLALKFAKMLNCKADFEERPCGKCQACQEIEQNRHPDLSVIEPNQGTIKIDRVRDLINKLSRKPYRGPFKIAIVDQAHLMTQEAESALLKTVEEPKGKTVLILVTSHKDSLATTLVSRTQNIEFFPVVTSNIKKFLQDQGIKQERAEKIAEISLGRPGLAQQLTNPEVFEQHQEKLKQLEQLVKGSFADRFQCAEELSKEKDLNYILELWLSQFRRALLSKITEGHNEFNYSVAKIRQVLNELQRIRRLLETTNVNKRLALETLMIKL